MSKKAAAKSGVASPPPLSQTHHHAKATSHGGLDDWETGARYDIVKLLGKGSYGKVAEAIDRTTGQKVAIKQMKNIFDEPTDAKRAYREIHILRHLKHPNIIGLYDVISTTIKSSDFNVLEPDPGAKPVTRGRTPSSARQLGDLYLVFEYMDTDLSNIIKSNQYVQTEHIQFILYQILCGLKFIHSCNVIHRDLKPANILVSCTDCTTKIADFGLSRVVDASLVSNPHHAVSDVAVTKSIRREMTEHVITRWYRAPEVILSQPYTAAVDMWSVGCIFAELFGMQKENRPEYKSRKPLFPGDSCGDLSAESEETYVDWLGGESGQIMIIFKVLGTPTEADLLDMQDDYVKDQIRNLPKRKPMDLQALFPGADPLGIDLLQKMLTFNPLKRLTVNEALSHPFLASKRQDEFEFDAEIPMSAAVESVGETGTHLYENTAKTQRNKFLRFLLIAM